MTDLAAIEQRVSRRTYSGKLTHAQLRKLEERVAVANLGSGLSIQLLEDGAEAFGGITKSYGMFVGVNSLLVLAGPKNLPHLKELCGYHGQRLVLDATKLQLGTCWVGGTFDRKRLAQALPAGQALVAVITVGPVKPAKSLVEKAVGRLMAGRGKKPADLCSYNQPPPKWFEDGVNAALRAPSAMNKQPVRFSYENGTAAAGVNGDEGLKLVDLGIAKLHFEIGASGRFEPGNPGRFIREEPL